MLSKVRIFQSLIRQRMLISLSTDIRSLDIMLAHPLNLTVLTEGGETIEELNYLNSQHCDEIQRFFYTSALPEEDFLAFVKKHNKNAKPLL